MCTGGGYSEPPKNNYAGQVREYAGGYGSVTTDIESDGKIDSEKYFDDQGKAIKKKQINKKRQLVDLTSADLQIPT